MMNETVYLFIDGAYLREVYEDLFKPVFGIYPVDYELLKKDFDDARRVFLYDCLDDVRKAGESQTDFDALVQRQREDFDAIDKVEGVHVRYGYLSPGKRKQQKEVDVSLAVDMLTHSFSRNMSMAVLLSGDRDFKPLVEALVRLGTYVQLVYEPRSGARELALAADSEMEIDITALCKWAKVDKYQDRTAHFPGVHSNPNIVGDPVLEMSPHPTTLRTGIIGPANRRIMLYDISNVRYASVQVSATDYKAHSFRDEAKLVAYVTKLYGDIVWQGS